MVKIIYLEDEEQIRNVTTEYLSMANFDVDVVKDVREAHLALELNHYDVAILDILVPFGTGFDVLENIHLNSPETLCIMLTALDDESSQIKAFNAFADDYIIKPFSPVLLIKRLEALCRRGIRKPNADVTGLELSTSSYEVYYDGVSLNVTYTEFLICETLINNPNQVFTRERLLNVIAPDDYMVSDRVVDAHVKNIRKKSPVPIIKTIIGAGYQFQGDAHETNN